MKNFVEVIKILPGPILMLRIAAGLDEVPPVAGKEVIDLCKEQQSEQVGVIMDERGVDYDVPIETMEHVHDAPGLCAFASVVGSGRYADSMLWYEHANPRFRLFYEVEQAMEWVEEQILKAKEEK
ncbi:MAG: hypothetical protein HQL71_11920 [Magnetococcales bacterium]|nr:hypothetical protein [Magnetococcales bacterium]